MRKILSCCVVAVVAVWMFVGGVGAEEVVSVEGVVDAYVGAWNEGDEDARRALLEKAWSDDGAYADPSGEALGRDALVDHIAGFLKNPAMKGFSMERVSGIDKHHNVLRFNWALKSADGKVVMAGIDFGVLADDGRLQSITGFFGPVPELD